MSSGIQSLWASVQGDPKFMQKTNGWLTIFWIANFPPIIAFYLLVDNEIFQNFCLLYLALVSIWANVAGHWSAWQASRVEVKQQAQMDADPNIET
jgi:preprotein translocase subunit SecG